MLLCFEVHGYVVINTWGYKQGNLRYAWFSTAALGDTYLGHSRYFGYLGFRVFSQFGVGPEKKLPYDIECPP